MIGVDNGSIPGLFNKRKLLQVYSAAFLTYVQVCRSLNVKLDGKFNLITKMENIVIVVLNLNIVININKYQVLFIYSYKSSTVCTCHFNGKCVFLSE